MSRFISTTPFPKMWMQRTKKLVLSFLLIGLSLFAQAQQVSDSTVEMADGMRSNGKIYVVVAVLLTVLIGLFIYIIRLDKKISKLEKQA
jgi:hypothetical protein